MRAKTISDEAKEQVARVLHAGDIAVDATMGNGWDTVFLAEEVGAQGQVYAFDVQETAVVATGKRLSKAGLDARVKLLKQGHETMAQVVPPGVGAVMFNLGYLPYAQRAITTQASSTVPALEAAIELLRPGGMVTIICYRGHSGGAEEAEAVWQFMNCLEKRDYTVMAPAALPEGEAPVLMTIQKGD